MKRRLTFSTHAFANKVLACTANWSCCVLTEMLYDRDPGGLRSLSPRHVTAWVRKHYLDEDVLTFYASDQGGHALSLVDFPEGRLHKWERRKAMAERLLAKPDRRASITVYL